MSPRKTMLLAAAAAMLWGTKAFSAILATDVNAMAGFHGTQDFSTAIGTLTMKGEADYAVYEPGKFNLTFHGGDPSANKRYVYAYQLHNTGGTTDRDLGFLSVGFDQNSPARFNPADLGMLLVGDHGDDPSSSSFIPASGPPYNSATWNFQTAIPDAHYSEILLFTSQYPPAFYDSSVQGGGLSKQSRLPSPVPEPGTALAACGMTMAFLLRRRNLK